MFVVMALITTFMTTPLTVSLYPTWYQIKVARWRRGEIDWNDKPLPQETRSDSVAAVKDQLKTVPVRKLLVYLRLDGLSGICTLAALLSPNREAAQSAPRVHPSKVPKPTEQSLEEPLFESENDETALRVHGVRLIELTDRDSSVMKVSAGDYAQWDPVVNTFRAFGEWQNVSLRAGVSVVPEHSYADTVVGMALQDTSDLLLLPWSETGTLADRQNGLEVSESGRFAHAEYAGFVSDVLGSVSGNVGILIEHGSDISARRPPATRSPSDLGIQTTAWTQPTPTGTRSHHIVLPFFGGDDDRFALRFVLQLAQNDHVTVTILQIVTPGSSRPKSNSPRESSDTIFLESLRDSIPEDLQDRVVFEAPAVSESITNPTQLALAAVRAELDQASNKSDSIVVVGRHYESTEFELSIDESVSAGTGQALGPLGSAMVQPENKVNGSVLVLQANANAVLPEARGAH